MGWGAKGRKLGRDTGERTALFRQLVASLILHDRIETTEAKAKETKKIADGLIALAVRGDPQARGGGRGARGAGGGGAPPPAARGPGSPFSGEPPPRPRGGRGGYTRVIKT